jgi:hypothetical protein
VRRGERDERREEVWVRGVGVGSAGGERILQSVGRKETVKRGERWDATRRGDGVDRSNVESCC